MTDNEEYNILDNNARGLRAQLRVFDDYFGFNKEKVDEILKPFLVEKTELKRPENKVYLSSSWRKDTDNADKRD